MVDAMSVLVTHLGLTLDGNAVLLQPVHAERSK